MAGKLSHIAMIVKDLDKAIAQFSALLGAGPFQTREIEEMGIKVASTNFGPLRLELMQPVDRKSPWWKTAMASDKPVALHHLGLDVDNMEAELARFQELGITVSQRRNRPGVDIAFLSSETQLGAMVELIQRLG